MKYQGIIFDCDGVLVDTESISCSVLAEMSIPFGLNMDLQFALQHLSGKSPKEMFSFIETQSGQTLPANFEKEYRKRSYIAYQQYTKPIEGIHQLLNKLSIPYCVASGGPFEKIILNLQIANLLVYFEHRIFSSYEINSWKPEPDIFLYAAKKMNFIPSKCIVIEDSLSGVEAAKRGGFEVYLYINNRKNQNVSSEIKCFTDMQNLDSILGLI